MLKTTSNVTRSLVFHAPRLRIFEHAFRSLTTSSDSPSSTRALEPVVSLRRKRPEGNFAAAIKRTAPSSAVRNGFSELDRRKGEYARKKAPYRSKVSLSEQQNLRPAVVSARIKAYASEGRIEDAVQMVLSVPRRAVNIITWNTLISEMMNTGRRKRAHQLYVEMKKRGYKPNLNTYITILKGMWDIDDWEKNSLQLENCHKLFDNYVEYLANLSKEDMVEFNEAAKYAPLVYYFRILGRVNLTRKLFDVFYSLDWNGTLKPTTYAYGAMLHGISLRSSPEIVGALTPQEQNAADAKLIWRRMEKDAEKGLVEMDEITIRYALLGLMHGRQSDVQFALDILRDYYGFAAPGEEAPPPRFQFNRLSLQVALALCNRAKKPRLCTYLAKQIMDQLRSDPKTAERLQLDRGHYDQMMIAYHSLANVGSLDESARAVDLLRWMIQEDALRRNRTNVRKDVKLGTPNIYPSDFTFAIAFTLCLRCVDWSSACEAFSFLSNLNPQHYSDEAVTARDGDQEEVKKNVTKLRSEQVRVRRGTTASYAQFARTALATGNAAHIRQCLRLLVASRGTHTVIGTEDRSHYAPFYRGQLASSILKMLDHVRETAGFEDEQPAWGELRAACKKFFTDRPKHRLSVPPYEVSTLGSQAYMNKVEQTIDFEMAARSGT